MKQVVMISVLGMALLMGSAVYANDTTAADKVAADNVTTQADKGGHYKKVEEMIASFPADKKKLVNDAIDAGKKEAQEAQIKLKAINSDLKTIVTSPTFDKSAYVAKNTELQEEMGKLHSDRVARMADLAAQLTADERKALAGFFVHEQQDWNKRWKHGKKDNAAN